MSQLGASMMRRRADAAMSAIRARVGQRRAMSSSSSSPAWAADSTSAPAEPAHALDPVQIAARRDRQDAENMRRLIAFCLPRDANCVDVGCHRGAILQDILRVAPDGHHVAFEPLPHLCEFLRQTFPSVDIHQSALSNRQGEAQFAYIHGPAEGWSGLRFRPLPTGEEAKVEQLQVRLEVLDEVLDDARPPALIKIDVEGAEQQVIEGAMDTLCRHRPIVIFEHGAGSANVYGTEPDDIHALLCGQVGLRIFDLDGSGPYTLEQFQHTYHACERVNFIAHV